MSTYSQGDMRESLENLFIDWREFEKPPLFNGAPDYRSNTFDLRIEKFNNLMSKIQNAKCQKPFKISCCVVELQIECLI